MVIISLYLFAFFMEVGSQPISPQKLMARHPDTKNPSPDSQGHSLSDIAVLPMEPKSLRRRSNGEGTVPSASDVQGQVSSLSRHTGSGVAGPERGITTPPNWAPPGQSQVATPGMNHKRSPKEGISMRAIRQHMSPGQAVRPGQVRTPSICWFDPGLGCW
ncbi:uncharacterized protein PGTG_09560 [Puccinia graminis f. sp. tritici CRL 75-36-700-3]|uniref:Uncharacterized protein n=1 Tax=Puccinia graminis f. sp. tritici (strain CRL 75-36-700-3 / race SCCL) TaxID=418459 RepID=E3KHS2_PUCGT|nr:uncharacterized protein PGTG_09560 [Puccinia graminis f. sp. tritici CRL 75-36-700-3]EFP83847.2 hypothetical protein PGTG_09560 [Puccinia graminis f. sp. tritici CRL 75-36-700-3]